MQQRLPYENELYFGDGNGHSVASMQNICECSEQAHVKKNRIKSMPMVAASNPFHNPITLSLSPAHTIHILLSRIIVKG